MDLQKVRDALITAIDAMGERRGYSEAFEYKYKEQWDEDDRIVREALAELEVKKNTEQPDQYQETSTKVQKNTEQPDQYRLI